MFFGSQEGASPLTLVFKRRASGSSWVFRRTNSSRVGHGIQDEACYRGVFRLETRCSL